MNPAAIDRLNAALQGRYRIESELGEGGMATVYLADDLKHERKVALKVLKPELAAVVGADRFLAEIKTTANLQHPHILPLFDSGEADSFLFYVMPYVEGESLRQRMTRERQLPIEEAVRVGAEVADALDLAHRRGVIHRDVKPENVLLQDGRVLVADFGIALAVRAGGGARLTETGLSLGTPAYMSPEQATGDREVDGRTDVYSLGCLIYEMLSGEPPHSGSNAQAVLASVLTQRPRPLAELRETVPAWLAAVAHRALERLPADRFADAGSLRERLLAGGTGDHHVMPGAGRRRVPLAPLIAAAAGIALATGVALGWLLFDHPSAEPLPTYFTASMPEGLRLRPGLNTHLDRSVTISPDGREVVFVGEHDGRRLYRLSLDAPGGVEPIAGTEGARSPFYSSTGTWIAFVSGTSLMKVPSGGGTPTQLAAVSGFRGGAWSPDDEHIYYAPFVFDGVWRMAADGGEPEEITRPAHDGVDDGHLFPAVLPNGDLLFTSCCGNVRTFILEEADPEGTPWPLLQGGGAQYVPSGHLVFMQRENVRIATYDPEVRQVGPPVPVLNGAITANEMYAEVAVSTAGTLAYVEGRSEFERPLVRIRPDGSSDSIPVPPGSHVFPIHFSPDGARLVYTSFEDGSHDVFAYDLRSGRQPRRLTTHPSTDYSQIWGPGPSRVTFSSIRGGGRDVYTVDVESSSEPELLIGDDLSKWPLSWTADGAWMLYSVAHPETGEDLWLYSAAADSAWAFLAEAYNEFPGAFAPSGDWLAYARDDVGQRKEVWALAFPDGVACPISIGGGTYPVWSSDGDRLYYMKGDTLMLAEAEGGDICDARPTPHVIGMNTVWGLAPDESYVVTVSPPPRPELRLVINWASDLVGRGRD